MRRGGGSAAAVLVAALAAAVPGQAVGQGGAALAARIDAAGAERVAFHFAVDDDVIVCEDGFQRVRDGDRERTRFGWRGDREARCPGGPLEVVVRRQGGTVRGLEMGPVGLEDRDADVGEVDPAEATAYLLSLHQRGASDRVAEEAMVGAVMARGAEPAPRLLEMARDRSLDSDLRRSALFWVSQVAAQGIDASLAGIAADEAEDQDVRDAAVFALSQRPEDESVPALMDLARTAPHAQTRRTALFWLSQADDDRVPDFFAELIRGAGG